MKKEVEKKYHYTVFYGDCEKDLHLIDEFKDRKDCSLIKLKYRGDNNILTYILRRIHTSFRLNKILHLPFRSIWYDFLYRKFEHPENEIVIVYATLFYQYDVDVFLKKWKKKNIKTYVIFLDSMKSQIYIGQYICPHIMRYVSPENILSFDKSDCKEYGFKYLNESYYSDRNIPDKIKTEYDAYLLARTKPGRSEVINHIYELCKKHGVDIRIDFVAEPELDKDFYKNPAQLNPEIKVIKRCITYKEAVKRASKANCIIEVGQGGVNAPTLRYFESVAMNKKLLTNIAYTKNLNFYNEKYMKITDFDEKNIDFDWIKKREKIDYKYKNEFSPINILSIIDKLEKSK